MSFVNTDYIPLDITGSIDHILVCFAKADHTQSVWSDVLYATTALYIITNYEYLQKIYFFDSKFFEEFLLPFIDDVTIDLNLVASGKFKKKKNARYSNSDKFVIRILESADFDMLEYYPLAFRYYRNLPVHNMMTAVIIGHYMSNADCDTLYNMLDIDRKFISLYASLFFDVRLFSPLEVFSWIKDIDSKAQAYKRELKEKRLEEVRDQGQSKLDVTDMEEINSKTWAVRNYEIQKKILCLLAYQYGSPILRFIIAPLIKVDEKDISEEEIEYEQNPIDSGDDIYYASPLINSTDKDIDFYFEDQHREKMEMINSITTSLMVIIAKVQASVEITDSTRKLADVDKLYKSLLNLMQAKDIIKTEATSKDTTLPLSLKQREIIHNLHELDIDIVRGDIKDED